MSFHACLGGAPASSGVLLLQQRRLQEGLSTVSHGHTEPQVLCHDQQRLEGGRVRSSLARRRQAAARARASSSMTSPSRSCRCPPSAQKAAALPAAAPAPCAHRAPSTVPSAQYELPDGVAVKQGCSKPRPPSRAAPLRTHSLPRRSRLRPPWRSRHVWPSSVKALSPSACQRLVVPRIAHGALRALPRLACLLKTRMPP